MAMSFLFSLPFASFLIRALKQLKKNYDRVLRRNLLECHWSGSYFLFSTIESLFFFLSCAVFVFSIVYILYVYLSISILSSVGEDS